MQITKRYVAPDGTFRLFLLDPKTVSDLKSGTKEAQAKLKIIVENTELVISSLDDVFSNPVLIPKGMKISVTKYSIASVRSALLLGLYELGVDISEKKRQPNEEYKKLSVYDKRELIRKWAPYTVR